MNFSEYTDILSTIKEISLSNKIEEICGLIYLKDKKLELYPCENVSFDKRKNFIINPFDFRICKTKGDIVACYHSHVKGGGFSGEDISNSLNIELPYILYNNVLDKFYFFYPKDKIFYKNYVNLKYIHGVNDCWSTIGRYINSELKINIKDPEPSRIYKKDTNLSWDYEARKIWMQESNLMKVIPKDYSDIQRNDILVMKTPKEDFPSFGALVLDDNLILHQTDHQDSKIEHLRRSHVKMIQYAGRFIS